MRLDTASILKRFFFCEQALIVAEAGWVASIPQFDIKTLVPRFLWEDAMVGNALRDRVFELHYPSRLMTLGDDSALISVMQWAIHAPSAEAFILSLAKVLKPAFLTAYRQYLEEVDEIADGPSLRFMRSAVEDKTLQIAILEQFATEMLSTAPDKREQAEHWCAALAAQLEAVGGLTLTTPKTITPDPSDLDAVGRTPFVLAEKPARDARFFQCRFYWPDVVDPTFPYGEGMELQLRSAISHINEVWAVEAAGAGLHAFSQELGWEFTFEAARWCYDEARHARMGWDRLQRWGFAPAEIPLGRYIYDSGRPHGALYLLAMLAYFETKNIGKKNQRARAFAEYQDSTSQHDMEFDWADETIHASYGAKWLEALRVARPDDVPDFDEIRKRCNQFVAEVVATCTEKERDAIREVANALIQKAERLATANN